MPEGVSAASVPRDDRPVTLIEPPQGLDLARLRELPKHRALLAALVRRQIRLDFSRMHLGVAWAMARPLVMLGVFGLFRHLSEARIGVTIPYPLYLYAGLIYWFSFTETVTGVAGSIRRDAGLIRKVYYPRLLTPLVPVIANLLSLTVASLPLVAMMAWWRIGPGWSILLLPLVLLQTSALALGLGLVFAALTLASRDWERFLALALYVGLFVSPVIFGPEMIPEEALIALYANPMAGTLLAFRAAIFDVLAFPWAAWSWSLACSIGILAAGVATFQRIERGLADRL